jgi:hypothetical protein
MEADDIHDMMWLWPVSENYSVVNLQAVYKTTRTTFKDQSVLESRASL